MSIWTEERVEQLKALWSQGLSTQAIADALGEGITKNSVIGKTHRLKLNVSADRPQRARAERSPRKSSTPRLPRARLTAVRSTARMLDSAFNEADLANLPVEIPFELPATDKFGTAALLGLTETTCKWPIGDPRASDFRFCGHHIGNGAYCEHHNSRAYEPAERRRRAA